MLTADLVQTHRRADRLFVRQLKPEIRLRALTLAEQYVGLLGEHERCPREELLQALAAVPVHPSDHKLSLGLQKLLLDRCEFEGSSQLDPVALRREVFTRAGELRRECPDEGAFDRRRVLSEIALHHELTAESLDAALFCDLKSAHRLIRFDSLSARTLLGRYETSQIQAVLLRAVHVTLAVLARDPAAYRLLFHKLKFLRLLHTLEPASNGGYTIEVEGPFALFESVTKYGLQLALLLPSLDVLDSWRLEADVRWGKAKRPLKFVAEGQASGQTDSGLPGGLAHLPDESRALVLSFRDLESPWQIHPAADILELPGLGLCVPDLRLVHQHSGEVVYLEVMGYWSRQAVWRRVELVEAGLPYKIIFAVSHRLRVSEQVLDDHDRACLYVYKGTLSARAILKKLEKLS